MNSAICRPRIIGSVTAQKLCILSVTGTRNSTISQAPILALYPSVMLKPPSVAITPGSGDLGPAVGCDRHARRLEHHARVQGQNRRLADRAVPGAGDAQDAQLLGGD